VEQVFLYLELFTLVVEELEITEMALVHLYGVTVVLEAVELVEKKTAALAAALMAPENLELTVLVVVVAEHTTLIAGKAVTVALEL
jgi:hypothetical protein